MKKPTITKRALGNGPERYECTDGVVRSVPQIARIYGIEAHTFRKRIRDGVPVTSEFLYLPVTPLGYYRDGVKRGEWLPPGGKRRVNHK